MISITFPVAPLQSPTSDHKFIVSMTEAFVVKNKVGTIVSRGNYVGTNPHISSGDTAFAMEEE